MEISGILSHIQLDGRWTQWDCRRHGQLDSQSKSHMKVSYMFMPIFSSESGGESMVYN
jgi:hypothetical protein